MTTPTFVIIKNDNAPITMQGSRDDLGAELERHGFTRGRFTHPGGQPVETAPLYKTNGWLAGAIYQLPATVLSA